jgi:nitrogen fixation/metabolism regulation signal transduction histidine kinase
MTWTIELDRIAANYCTTTIGYAELMEIHDLVESFRAYARPHKLGHVALELRAARARYTSPERRCATPPVRSRAAL